MEWLSDLTPCLSDPCWQSVLLAHRVPVGVVLRRGPSKWWHLTLWDTRQDRFTSGQWFHGSLYPRKCDLSPDGTLFSYFGGKFRASDAATGYSRTWVAVSRPPYFTALALWPVGDTWGGQTRFLDDGSFCPAVLHLHHPDHPPGPLRVMPQSYLNLDDPLVGSSHFTRRGWRPVPLAKGAKKTSHFDPLLKAYHKTVEMLCLARAVSRGEDQFPSRTPSRFTLLKQNESTELAQFEAHWADFDQGGRLVAAAGGRILEGRLDRHHGLRWRPLAEFQNEKPKPVPAPEWAQHW